MRVDLHIHSTASDGRWHPAPLVDQVRKTGIDLFAVADHDTVANVLPVQAAMRGSGLGFIRAVEISSMLNGHNFHVVGYGIDPRHPALERLLADNREKMEGVDLESIRKLVAAGYDISYQEYERYENDPTRGVLLAELMEEQLAQRIIHIEQQEAIDMTHRLSEEEGLFCGLSGGANVLAALRLAREMDSGRRIVTILPDNRDRYLFKERFTT